MSTRTRVLAIVGGIVALLALGLMIAVYVMLQPSRVTALLRSASRSVGLELRLGAPAQPTLFPQPGLVLHGLELTPIGSPTPMLIAVRGRVEVPWRVLLGSPPAITRLQLDAPRLDLDSLQRLAANLRSNGSAKPSLPRIDAGISIRHGVLVRGNRLLLDQIEVSTGRLAPEQPFDVHVGARTAGGTPYSFDLDVTPHERAKRIDFDRLHVRASGKDRFKAVLNGTGKWHGGADIELSLTGTVQRPKGQTYQISLGLQPASTDTPLTLALKLDGGDTHANLQLPPLALSDWWRRFTGNQADVSLAPPAITGQASADHIDLGKVRIDGLKIQAGPAPASSTNAGNPP